LVCLFLRLTGFDRLVAASYSAQQRVNRQIEEAIVDYGRSETTQLERLQSDPPGTDDEPEKRRPGHPPKAPMRLDQAEHALDTARREHVRLAQQREQVRASIRGLGHDYHFVDLERGVRRNGQLIASDIQAHIDQIRTVAQQKGLSQSCLERIDKAERAVSKTLRSARARSISRSRSSI
jgi:hypothetical protein